MSIKTSRDWNAERRARAKLNGTCPQCEGVGDRLPRYRTCTGCAWAKRNRKERCENRPGKKHCLCGNEATRKKQCLWVCERCDKIEAGQFRATRPGIGVDVHYYAVCFGSRRFS